MRLWSYQGVGHSLTDGHIDPSRLPYLETVPRYADAIKELAKRIGEPSGQFIWCLTRVCEVARSLGLKLKAEASVA